MPGDQKYSAPDGPPPPAYGSGGPATPQPAHTNHTGSSAPTDYYNTSPAPQNVYPQQEQQQHPYPQPGYPSSNVGGYPPQPQQGGYYAPGPQMGYAPQQTGYGHPQGPYGPQGYGQPQGGYYGNGYAPGYGPQGQYLDDRRGGSAGCLEGLLASLACCCCLDLLLF